MRYLCITALAAMTAVPMAPLVAQAHSTVVPVTHVSATGASDTSHVVTIDREVFQYQTDGRRDPFMSLLNSTELRPTIADLRLTTVAYDPTGGNSVAIMRDLGTKAQYRVRVGSVLGRMRVVRIDQKAVTFAIEEFGFSRQETLTLGDSTSTRTP